MTTTVLMYERGYEVVRERLGALGLDVIVRTFDRDGVIMIDGKVAVPAELDVDYLWLSPEVSFDKIQKAAFGLAIDLRSVGVVQTFNAGLDHPSYKKLAARGARICNSSAQGIAIAEFVFAHVMAAFHPIAERRELQAARQWQTTPFREIAGSNWLVVGYGPIGEAIAKRAQAFEANVTVVRRSAGPCAFADAVGTQADLQRLLPSADVVVLACPLNDQTRGMADAGFFAAMKTGSVLANIARGALIDDTAMLAALDRGQLGTAILDVFHTEPLPTDSPLWVHPKVVATAHTSFAGSGTLGRWHQLFLDNLPRFMRGEPLIGEVDSASI